MDNHQIAECVGLWLAEGDNKTKMEITFTNSETDLIKHFNKVLRNIFSNYKFNIRLYVYSSNNKDVIIPIKVNIIKRYTDKRANRPYYIWRLASVELNKKWRIIVENYKQKSIYYSDILRGFFAGEGNIKTGSHNNRTIRIAQKKSSFLEKLLKYFKIEFNYRKEERSYSITHKDNWDKLAKIRIGDLHPLKNKRFWEVYNGFKESHYKHNYLKNSVFNILNKSHLPIDLASKFNRSKARIQEILVNIKKEGKINNFRVGSISYWIRNDSNTIIISRLKKEYIDFLSNSNKTTKEIANYFNVNYKSSFRRLKELEKLNLVSRNKNKTWKIIKPEKKVIVI